MADADLILADWNRMEAAHAAEAILPCNGSHAWAEGVARMRPLTTGEEMFAAADRVWWALPERDWQQAFDSHPRLGERKAKTATEKSLSWSTQEQSAANPDEVAREALARANVEYEMKFGRIFLLCATGRAAEEMLAIMRLRLQNDAATELHEAAEQQRLITQLRLRKWLQLPALTCTELMAARSTEAA